MLISLFSSTGSSEVEEKEAEESSSLAPTAADEVVRVGDLAALPPVVRVPEDAMLEPLLPVHNIERVNSRITTYQEVSRSIPRNVYDAYR